MFRHLLATTALTAFTLSAVTGFAAETRMNKPVFSEEMQTEMTVDDLGYFTASETDILVTNLLDAQLYNGSGEEAEMIGDVNDIVVGANGNAEAVIVGVGGFLDIGEKDVAIDFDRISWSEIDGVRRLMIEATREELEAAPAYDRRQFDAAYNPVQPSEEQHSDLQPTPEAKPELSSDETAEMKAEAETDAVTSVEKETPSINERMELADRSDESIVGQPATTQDPARGDFKANLVPALHENISAEKLIGATVYGSDNQTIGEIGDVLLSDEKIHAFVVDVGGFLGLGEKPVAVDIERIEVMSDESGKLWVFTPFTEEQLQEQDAYSEADYTNAPDSNVVQ